MDVKSQAFLRDAEQGVYKLIVHPPKPRPAGGCLPQRRRRRRRLARHGRPPQGGADDKETETDTRWAKTLRTRLDGLAHEQTANALEKAQLLLDLPIRRALASAATYADQSAT